MQSPPPDLESAYDYCGRLAAAHYENFPVASRLIPAERRKHIAAVYAFARTADDFADEPGVTDRLGKLDDWEAQLVNACKFENAIPPNPIFLAVRNTIRLCDLPVSLFLDLLSAFKQDVTKSRYMNFPEVMDYARRSANPVGRLVLLIFGYREESFHLWSDKICTALQLANFWQDIAVDLKKDRIYVPQDDLNRFGVTEQELFSHQQSAKFREMVRFQVNRTEQLFMEGKPLCKVLNRDLRLEIRVTWLGGMSILDKIRSLDYGTLLQRPKHGTLDKLRILGRALFWK